MALVKCKECGSEISNKAAVCPRCGAKPRRTSGFTWFVLISFVCWLAISSLPHEFAGTNSSLDVRTPSPTAQKPSETPHSNASGVSASPQPVTSTITHPFEMVPLKVDVKKLAGKSVQEVNAVLGKPSSRAKIPEGDSLNYESKGVEIVFQNAKANLITISNLESVPFTPSAITAIGLPISERSFASAAVLRWKNIQGIDEVSIFPGQKGCDYAYVIFNTREEKETTERIKNWNYSHSDYAMSKGRVHQAITDSTNTVNFRFPYQGSQHGTLILRTHPKFGKDVILRIEKGQFLVRSYEDSKALVRFDDGDSINFRVVGAKDESMTMAFFLDYQGFVDKMRKAKRVRISIPVYQEGSPVFEFDVSGFEIDAYLEKTNKG